MPSYIVNAAAVFSASQPNHSLIQAPPALTSTVISEEYLVEFILNMNGWTFQSNAITDDDFRIDLRNKARLHFRALGGAQPILSASNPIFDAYVIKSRPTGVANVWSYSPTFAIHPVTNPNYPDPGPINIAIAPHLVSGIPAYWLNADAYANR